MPELPEVETIRRTLDATVLGASIRKVWTSGKPLRMLKPIDPFVFKVTGEIVSLRRWAKYLLVDVGATKTVVVHLGMSGRLQVVDGSTEKLPHTHVVWTLGDGRELRYVDPRRFGTIAVVERGAESEFDELANLGIDPLGPGHTAAALGSLAKTAKRPAKAFLLDQSKIAGLGNIYVCEALFEARIHPLAHMSTLSKAQVHKLHKAIVQVLERGIANRGTTFRDYTDAQGQKGGNQHSLRVYGREGEPCRRRDGGTIRRVSSQGRGTFFCPRCQLR